MNSQSLKDCVEIFLLEWLLFDILLLLSFVFNLYLLLYYYLYIRTLLSSLILLYLQYIVLAGHGSSRPTFWVYTEVQRTFEQRNPSVVSLVSTESSRNAIMTITNNTDTQTLTLLPFLIFEWSSGRNEEKATNHRRQVWSRDI